MSQIIDFCLLPNPAHRPHFYAGFSGLSSSFPASIVCILYIHLEKDMPTHSISLSLETTLEANAASVGTDTTSQIWNYLQNQKSHSKRHGSRNPASHAATPVSCSNETGAALKFPIKHQVHISTFKLWKNGALASEHEQDQGHFTVRYVSPTAVFHFRQDRLELPPRLRRTFPRSFSRSGSYRTVPSIRLLSEQELGAKPSLYPVQEPPSIAPTLASGIHLFYFECEIPDLPGELYLSNLNLQHRLVATLKTPCYPFPLNLLNPFRDPNQFWIKRVELPINLPRYNQLPLYLTEKPIIFRNPPSGVDPCSEPTPSFQPLYEVEIPKRVLVAGTSLRIHVRIIPNETMSRRKRTFKSSPKVRVKLFQTTQIQIKSPVTGEKVLKSEKTFTIAQNSCSIPSHHQDPSILVLELPPAYTSWYGSFGGDSSLHPSCEFRFDLASVLEHAHCESYDADPLEGERNEMNPMLNVASGFPSVDSTCNSFDSLELNNPTRFISVRSTVPPVSPLTYRLVAANVKQGLRKLSPFKWLSPCLPSFSKESCSRSHCKSRRYDSVSSISQSSSIPASLECDCSEILPGLEQSRTNDVQSIESLDEPPNYEELDIPVSPTLYTDQSLKPTSSSRSHTELSVQTSHHVTITAIVGSRTIFEHNVPIIINYGKESTCADIVRYVCA
jgi:hypothetical protein